MKDGCVRQFVRTAGSLLEDPDVPDRVKDYLSHFGDRIEDRSFARMLVRSVTADETPAVTSPLLTAIACMDEARQAAFYEATAHLFIAASFADREGYRFRNWFMGKLIDRTAVSREVQSVYEADPVPYGALAA